MRCTYFELTLIKIRITEQYFLLHGLSVLLTIEYYDVRLQILICVRKYGITICSILIPPNRAEALHTSAMWLKW